MKIKQLTNYESTLIKSLKEAKKIAECHHHNLINSRLELEV